MDLLDPLHAVCSTDRNPSVINDNFQTPRSFDRISGVFPVHKVPVHKSFDLQNLVDCIFYLPYNKSYLWESEACLMIKSMTGFGRHEMVTDECKISVEIKR